MILNKHNINNIFWFTRYETHKYMKNSLTKNNDYFYYVGLTAWNIAKDLYNKISINSDKELIIPCDNFCKFYKFIKQNLIESYKENMMLKPVAIKLLFNVINSYESTNNCKSTDDNYKLTFDEKRKLDQMFLNPENEDFHNCFILNQIKDKIYKLTKLLVSMLPFLFFMPCNFFPFAYIEIDNDMSGVPLLFWVIVKLQFLYLAL